MQAAACIGRAFTADFLAALLQESAVEVIEPLEALVDAEILRPNHEGREIRFEFRHALLQRAAYKSMVQSERRATHASIVKELQQIDAAAPLVPELIAHHLTGSDQFREAAKAWLDAGMNAARRSAHIEAIEHLRRGLSLLNEISPPELRTTTRAQPSGRADRFAHGLAGADLVSLVRMLPAGPCPLQGRGAYAAGISVPVRAIHVCYVSWSN